MIPTSAPDGFTTLGWRRYLLADLITLARLR